MSAHLGRNADGRIQLERTGPFIPPITLPGVGDVVVTSPARSDLERWCVGDLQFAPVHKARIVRLDWTSWSQTAAEPLAYPESGEPENYVLGRSHEDACASELGELFELVPPSGGSIAREEVQPRDAIPKAYRFTIEPDSIPSSEIFRVRNTGRVVVTDRLRARLAQMADNALDFHPMIIGPLPPPQLPLYRSFADNEAVPGEYEVTGHMQSPFTGESMRVARLRR